MFDLPVTKDCKQSQSNFELREMPVSRAFLYISFRVSSKEAPLQVPLTELPHTEMLHFRSPPSNISQGSQETDPPPGSQTVRDTHFQSLILHIP